ncbi:retrovirus-related pol polyprotein from transposon TNT 1-94 [Tanacetum coccineum]
MLMMLLRVMMFISYMALLFGYYMKKKLKGSHAYFVEYGNCLFLSSTKWVIDSGASDHMTGNSHIFNNFDTHASSSHVTIVDGSILQVLGSSTVNLSPSISLSSVLSLPKFSFNLLSVSRITSNLQCSVKFYPEYCVFKDLKTKKIIGRGIKCDGLYVFEPKVSKSLVGLSSSSLFEAHCPNKRAASPFELVRSDVWGPCPVTSKSGFKYFATFVDDYFRVTWLYLMKNQSEDTQPNITKLDPKSLKCALLGYSRIQKGYRCYSPQLHCYLISSDVTFHEDLPYFPVTTYRHQEENDDIALNEAYSNSDAPSDARGGSDLPPPSFAPELDLPIASRKVVISPKDFGEALAHFGWRTAMIEEMNALEHNGTWDLVDLPFHKKPISCKWVFSVKMNLDGLIA